MKVFELMAELSEMPAGAEVVVSSQFNKKGLGEMADIKVIRWDLECERCGFEFSVTFNADESEENKKEMVFYEKENNMHSCRNVFSNISYRLRKCR